jgi:methyl-accepting chemotaxis protein
MEEQSAGSRQVLQSVSELHEVTARVKDGSAEMLSGSQQIIAASGDLERAASEINKHMEEMSGSAHSISTAVTTVNDISEENKQAINALVNEIARFTVE